MPRKPKTKKSKKKGERASKWDIIRETLRIDAIREALKRGEPPPDRRDLPVFGARKRECEVCGKSPAPIESVITGKRYCSVEHRDEDKERTGEVG